MTDTKKEKKDGVRVSQENAPREEQEKLQTRGKNTPEKSGREADERWMAAVNVVHASTEGVRGTRWQSYIQGRDLLPGLPDAFGRRQVWTMPRVPYGA